MELIFEKSQAGRRAGRVASHDLPVPEVPAELRRARPPRLPELAENEIVRHFTNLADRKIYLNRHEGTGGIHCIATGMHYSVLPPSNVLYAQCHRNEDVKAHVDQFAFGRKALQVKRRPGAEAAPTLFAYLRDNIQPA